MDAQKAQIRTASVVTGIEPKPAPDESLCNETWGPQLARGSAGEAGSMVICR